MLAKGDKLVVTKDVASFLRAGDIVEVTNVDKGIIEFAFGDGLMHMGVMNQAECEAHFEKYVEPNKAQLEKIDELLSSLEQFKQLLLETKKELQNEYDQCSKCDAECGERDCCKDCIELEEDEEDDLNCDDCDDYDCPFSRNVYNR